MKITLITLGSRGDIQPYVPLAMGFRDAGYDITIATHEPYRDFVTQHGVQFAPVAGDVQEILSGDVGVEWIETQDNPLTSVSKMRELVLPRTMEMAETIIEACRDTDVILFSSLGFLAAPSLMEKHNLRGMGVFLQPANSTREHPFMMFPDVPILSNLYNRLSYRLINTIIGLFFETIINDIRTTLLDLPPYTESFHQFMKRPYPVAYGYSSHVQPRPADWDDHLNVTGYWFLDDDYTPPSELTDWLANGDAPIYVGFGSMTNRNPQETTNIVLESVEQTGVRCVLLSGWGGIGNANTSDDVYVAESVPHHWLFPQMRAVIHHGGAGTTAAGLRAGVPSVIVPHFADQPYWGKRVKSLKVGPDPILRSNLSVATLSRAMRSTIYDKPMQRRALELGERIRAEDGVANAIRFFEDYVLKYPPVI